MPNAFSAQAYDLPDLGASNPGPPAQYEGGLHPRNKWTLSNRLALAGLAIAYKNTSISYTGPVLSSCSLNYQKQVLLLHFDADILDSRGDVIIMKYKNGVQVQTSTSLNGWFDVNITGIDGNIVTVDLSPILGNVQLHGKRKRRKRDLRLKKKNNDGYGYGSRFGDDEIMITGVRYAWSDMPCCPEALILWPQRNYTYSCAEAQCALYTKKYDLPAIPFIYKMNKIGQVGNCLMTSTSNNM